MKNLLTKIVPLVAIPIISLSSLLYAKDLPPQSMPVDNYEIESSRTEQNYLESWKLSEGLNFNRNKKILSLENSDSFRWYLDKEQIIIKNNNNEDVFLSDFISEGIDEFPEKKLKQIILELVSGKTSFEDIVLSESSNFKVGDILTVARIFDNIAQINQGDNFFKYDLSLKVFAKADFSQLNRFKFKNSNSEIEVFYGAKLTGSGLAEAHLKLNLNQNKQITQEDILKNFPYEANIFANVGYDYSITSTIKKFFEMKNKEIATDKKITLGIIQSNSTIDTFEYDTNFSANLKTNFHKISTLDLTEKIESTSIKKINSTLFYGIFEPELFSSKTSSMIGLKKEEITKTGEVLIRKKENHQTLDSKERSEISSSRNHSYRYSSENLIYGLSIEEEIFSIEKNITSSIYSTLTNITGINSLGITLHNPYLSLKLDSDGNKDILISLIKTKQNFQDYFSKQIQNEINPMNEFLESKLHTELLEQNKGLFIRYSQKDNLKELGAFIGFNDISYIECGSFISENNKGNFLGIGLGNFHIDYIKQKYSEKLFNGEPTDKYLKGEKNGFKMSYLVQGGMLGLSVEEKAEELGIKNIGIIYSGNSKIIDDLLKKIFN
ncbi:MAG: hypothetical protein OQK82_00905 [Candidatus Pacearchaeota archaeon]|nr:hypothetical protein [Candidatus Pacearchaeota archaeon]